jgi:hypothetical protein
MKFTTNEATVIMKVLAVIQLKEFLPSHILPEILNL